MSALQEWVASHEGTTPISKVLIANNGISAVKAISYIRRWAYKTLGDEKAVTFVAMATPEDLKANAEYIRMADEFVEVPGGSNVNNYANVNLIVQLALRYAVDAVWAGWGHASENPVLPNSLEKHNVIFIGPPGPPMHALGDKIGSTIIAQSAGVPTIAWNGGDIRMDYKSSGGEIPDDVYAKANVTTGEACLAAVEKVGLPVMIKASEGGGGKGIRMVSEMDKVEAAYRQVQSEVPGSPIFVMRLAHASRHLEVQLLADNYGNAIALSGRDCSVQRRHQKILEEGPPVIAEKSVWREMEKAAVRLAKEVDYRNAGTVEYLYAMDSNEFFFLELNPRLQVEHPVTEMITGVNLPAAQLQVAMGIPLHRIADIRRLYGAEDPSEGSSSIDFDNSEPIIPPGHVIAARITAENPSKGFQPTSGRIQNLNFRSSRNVWGYFSMDSSGNVHEFADSQIGHLFSWGANREEARKNLVMALNDVSIRGDIRTTVEYLKDLIESEDYKNNAFDTAWLDARLKTHVATVSIPAVDAVLVGASCYAYQDAVEKETNFLSALVRGQLPPPALLEQAFAQTMIYENVKYELVTSRTGPSTFCTSLASSSTGTSVSTEVRALADGGFLVLMGGKSHVAYLKDEVGARRLVVDQQTCLFTDEYDPTMMRATMGGKLIQYLVDDGARVSKEQPFAEVEVMKMNMPLLAMEDGTLSHGKPAGAVMEPGDVIATLELDDPSKVSRSESFRGELGDKGDHLPAARRDDSHHTLARAVAVLNNLLDGYAVDNASRKRAIEDLVGSLNDPALPCLEVNDLLSQHKHVLPFQLHDELSKLNASFADALREGLVREDAQSGGGKRMLGQLQKSMSRLDVAQMAQSAAAAAAAEEAVAVAEAPAAAAEVHASALVAQYCADVVAAITKHTKTDAAACEAAKPIADAVVAFRNGLSAYAIDYVLSSLLERYREPEHEFAKLEHIAAAERDDELQQLRKQFAADLPRVYSLALSHAGVAPKNEIALVLLETLQAALRRDEVDTTSARVDGHAEIKKRAVGLLQSIATLRGSLVSEVALEARQVLIELQAKSQEASREDVVEKLIAVARGDAAVRNALVSQSQPVLHHLVATMLSSTANEEVQASAMDVYARRVYREYTVSELNVLQAPSLTASSGQIATFDFFSESNDDEDRVQMNSATATGGMHAVGSMEDLGHYRRQAAATDSDAATPNSLATGGGVPMRGATPSKHRRDDSHSRPRSASGWDDESTNATSLAQAQRVSAEEAFVPGEAVPPYVVRKGVLACFDNVQQLKDEFATLLDAFNAAIASAARTEMPVNALHLVLRPSKELSSPEALSDELGALCRLHADSLVKSEVRRVTFAVPPPEGVRAVLAGHGSGFFTYRASSGFQEDRLVRNIEPSLAFQLDLGRLANFHIELVPLGKSMDTLNRTVHVYKATPKFGSSNKVRYFIRALVRNADKLDDEIAAGIDANSSEAAIRDAYPGPERVLLQAIAALESVQADSDAVASAHNHVFLNILGDSVVAPPTIEASMRRIAKRYASRLGAARVAQVELKVRTRLSPDAPGIPIRLVASNPTGYALRVDTYVEAGDPTRPGRSVFYSISDKGDGGVSGALAAMGLSDEKQAVDGEHEDGTGELHGEDAASPYPVSSRFDDKRARAMAAGTCYAYDLPALFQKSLENAWREAVAIGVAESAPAFNTLLYVRELVLSDEDAEMTGPEWVCSDSNATRTQLKATARPPGTNAIAMVGWSMTMKTPAYPEGREVVVIANDITVRAGSFGTREDRLFDQCSKYARLSKLPRFYVAANSGARIGMAEEVKRSFKTAWIDANDPAKGFEYLYLDAQSYQELGPDGRKSVICDLPAVEVGGESRFKIQAIVGEQPDLGVENLRGSGTIAGETSRAYAESFTLTYVSGRSVGIGAYLVRLGQRTIQKGTNAPILLTGYQALNSLMGSSVYSSNLQLGGPAIMYNNGVTHQCVKNDLDGVAAMLKWLEYVPRDAKPSTKLPTLKTLPNGESVDRDVDFKPQAGTSNTQDSRWLVSGREMPDGSFATGLFDRGSFTEVMGGWAKTIVTGRARLGGIPVGVIVPESRTQTAKTPADPASPLSNEQIHQQAGNVWFPDSAFKTASAIRDINGESLPLFFLANIRGFSGGQRDMFDQVLKFGSMIVDALVEFRQPVFVYIPPYAELRGGAWVVVDPTINEECMEMYCAKEARGGVLEPSGAAAIKFRVKDVLATMHRLDPQLLDLDKRLSNGEEVAKEIEERETLLMPVYKQLTLEFADAHDRPGRMQAKGVVRDVVDWKDSRRFLYWRLRRRMAEHVLHARMRGASDGVERVDKSVRDEVLFSAFVDGFDGERADWSDDKAVATFLESTQGSACVDEAIKTFVGRRVSEKVARLGSQDPKAMVRGLMDLITELNDQGRSEERAWLVNTLSTGFMVLGGGANAPKRSNA